MSAWRGHAVVMLTGRGSEDNCRVVSGQPRHSGVLHCRWSCVKHGHSQTWDQCLTRFVMESTILGESTRPTFTLLKLYQLLLIGIETCCLHLSKGIFTGGQLLNCMLNIHHEHPLHVWSYYTLKITQLTHCNIQYTV